MRPLALLLTPVLVPAFALAGTPAGATAPGSVQRVPGAGTAYAASPGDLGGPGVRVVRDASGRVSALRSGRGAWAEVSRRQPVAGARDAMLAHADEFGIDASEVVDGALLGSPRDGAVRFTQTSGGLPVLGASVVVGLGPGGATSAAVDVSDAAAPSVGTVGRPRAERVALAAVAALTEEEAVVSDAGLAVYDPSVVGDPRGLPVSSVWRVDVATPSGERLVLVDTHLGRAILVGAPSGRLSRVVCDNAERLDQPTNPLPCTSAPARAEGGAPVGDAEVDTAYDLLGAADDLWRQVAEVDLTALVGRSTADGQALAVTVRYCDSGPGGCPLDNAFWDGSQVYAGTGWAGAADVMGHELTHGVVDRTSRLFPMFASGAVGESVSDVMGEVLDRRTSTPGEEPGSDDGSRWLVGEETPVGALRDFADPTSTDQPDSVTSALYDADPQMQDSGGVHSNSGVGNKTAYLVAHGGTFGGVTVTGIDADSPRLPETAALWSRALQRLPSGADWADLADALEQTCTDLAVGGTAGITADDCGSVRDAVRATSLRGAPTVEGAGPAPAAPGTCPAGTVRRSLSSGLSRGSLWSLSPSTTNGVPANSPTTGGITWFGLNPDQSAGDPASSSLTRTTYVWVPPGQETYLHFGQWRLFDWSRESETSPAVYRDGGTVEVYAKADKSDTVAQEVQPASWVNGPEHQLAATPYSGPGWGGSSQGWTASRADLGNLAGQWVTARWTVRGGYRFSQIGWFVHSPTIYTCDDPSKPAPQPPSPTPTPSPTPDPSPEPPPAPSYAPPAARTEVAARVGQVDQVRLSWTNPTPAADAPLTRIEIWRDSTFEPLARLSPSTTSYALRLGQVTTPTVDLRVVAVGPGGRAGVSRRLRVTTFQRVTLKPYEGARGITRRLRGSTADAKSGLGLAGLPLQVQVAQADGTFRTVARLRTGANDGRFVHVFPRTPAGQVRVVYVGAGDRLGTTRTLRP